MLSFLRHFDSLITTKGKRISPKDRSWRKSHKIEFKKKKKKRNRQKLLVGKKY